MSVKTLQAKAFYVGILCAHSPDAACPLSQTNPTWLRQEVETALWEGTPDCLSTFVPSSYPYFAVACETGKSEPGFAFSERALELKMSLGLVGRAMGLDFYRTLSVSLDTTTLDIMHKYEKKQSAGHLVSLCSVS